MNCAEFEVLLHALIDDELDAGHACEVEAHAAACSACAENLASFRALHQAMSAGALKEATPAYLRSRVEAVPCCATVARIR
jgi:anti-sigma factor RsiW